MKHILTLCLLLCIISVASAEWEERQCEICGKAVYEWVLIFTRGSEFVDWTHYMTTPEIMCCQIKFSRSMKVCSACKKKYQAEVDSTMESAWNKWLEKVKAENVGTKKEQDEIRKEKELKEKIEQIKKLIDEIEVKFSVGGLDKAYCPRALMTDPCDAGSTYTGHKDEIVIDTTVVWPERVKAENDTVGDRPTDIWTEFFIATWEERWHVEKEVVCNAECVKRGHVRPKVYEIETVYQDGEVIDLSDRTLIVRHDPNHALYCCLRCGEHISEPVRAEPETTVVWREQ